ncbi:MAG: EamA family transporter RarD [Bacillota bacterium]|nr:EamA family transporter RarD [Bacillota bacterium]
MENRNPTLGLVLGALSYIMWGFLTIYWKLVDGIPPYEILAQRILWSFLFIVVVIALARRLGVFWRAITDWRVLRDNIPPAIFITLNWFAYIWAVNNGQILQAGLGYFINPLVLALLGRMFYAERLNRLEQISIAIATLGVAIKTVVYGSFPYLSIVMAFSFGFYGLFKKRSKLDSLTGLGVETFLTVIPSLIYILMMETSGQGIHGNLPSSFWFLIALSGAVTATPLLLYSVAAKNLSLTVLGFLQYFSPSISVGLAAFVYGEPFTLDSMISFGLIWSALFLFSISQYHKIRARRAQTAGMALGARPIRRSNER